MFKLPELDFPQLDSAKQQFISSFSPREIQLIPEGYALREGDQQYTLLRGILNLMGIAGIVTFIAFILLSLLPQFLSFLSIFLSLIGLSILANNASIILISIPLFFVVHRIMKLALDESARYETGAYLGFMPVELIFSHYPLKIGENDRLTFRRRLKQNFWTDLFKVYKFPDNSHLSLSLICMERASYTKGTDTVTEVAIAYQKVIYSKHLVGGDREIKAYFDLEIPPNFSASLEGRFNKIRWIFRLEENYPGLIGKKVSHLTFVVDP